MVSEINVKILFNGVVRKVRVDHSTTWDAFSGWARRAHGISSEIPILAGYTDPDGDVISIDSTEELREVLRQAISQNLSSLRLEITFRAPETGDSLAPPSSEFANMSIKPQHTESNEPMDAEGSENIGDSPAYSAEEKGKAPVSEGWSSQHQEDADPLDRLIEGVAPILEEIHQEFEKHPEVFAKLEELSEKLQIEAGKHVRPTIRHIEADLVFGSSYTPRFARARYSPYGCGPRHRSGHRFRFQSTSPFAYTWDGRRRCRDDISVTSTNNDASAQLKEFGFDASEEAMEGLLSEYGSVHDVVNALIG